MCSPAVFGIGAVISGVGAYMGYKNQNAALAQQSQYTMQNAMMQSGMMRAQAQMSMMQSSMLTAQAGMFGQAAGAFTQQAGMFMEQGAWANRMGKILSAQDYARARQTEAEAERAATVATEQRRQKIGAGLASFAGNGVSVDASSAVALWEQDEVADLAYEMGTIGEKRDNEVWGYVWEGDTKKMQGLFEAQSYAIQAKGAMINADQQRMQASQALGNAGLSRMQAGIYGMQAQNALLAGQAQVAQNNATRQNNLWGMVTSIAGIGTQAAGFYGGGFGQVGSPAAQTPYVTNNNWNIPPA